MKLSMSTQISNQTQRSLHVVRHNHTSHSRIDSVTNEATRSSHYTWVDESKPCWSSSLWLQLLLLVLDSLSCRSKGNLRVTKGPTGSTWLIFPDKWLLAAVEPLNPQNNSISLLPVPLSISFQLHFDGTCHSPSTGPYPFLSPPPLQLCIPVLHSTQSLLLHSFLTNGFQLQGHIQSISARSNGIYFTVYAKCISIIAAGFFSNGLTTV